MSNTRARLNALYDHTSGDITCRRPAGGEETLDSAHDAALDADEPFTVAPITSEGELAFYTMRGDEKTIRELHERVPATFVTRSGVEFTAVYKVEGAVAGDERLPDPDWVWTNERIIAGDIDNPIAYRAGYLSRMLYQQAWNHAKQFGLLPAHQLALPLKIAIGSNSRAKEWQTQSVTFHHFLMGATFHRIGNKDGQAFCQGEAIGGQRTKNAMKDLGLLCIDVDTGLPFEDVDAILMQADLTAVAHTTHSHMKRSSTIKLSAIMQWKQMKGLGEGDPTIEECQQWLREHRHMDERIIQSITSVRVDQLKEGMQVVVDHAPMSKCRVIFPLLAPFDVKEETRLTKSQANALKKWAAKVRGVGKMLGIPIDEACTDASRLFYLPRHEKGAEFDIRIYSGRLLDLNEVEGVEPGAASTADNAFSRAGERDAGQERANGADRSHLTAPDGTRIGSFCLKNGMHFDIMTFFDESCPDMVRDRKTDKYTVVCPNDDNHTISGDETDVGCWIASPQPEDDSSFVFKCRHNSCQGFSTSDMLAKACRLGWFSGKDLFNPQYRIEFEEGEGGSNRASEGSTPGEFESVSELVAHFNDRIAYVIWDGRHGIARFLADGEPEFMTFNEAKHCYANVCLLVEKNQ